MGGSKSSHIDMFQQARSLIFHTGGPEWCLHNLVVYPFEAFIVTCLGYMLHVKNSSRLLNMSSSVIL